MEVDNHKLIFHPERVAEWKKTGDCFPIYVEIGPTDSCNHRCIFCALDWVKKQGSFIDSFKMVSALKDMAKCGVKSVMFAGEGEPLLHPDISEFVKLAKRYGMDVSITTNGGLLTKHKIEQILPNLSWIRFSVDAATPETHQKIHQTRDFKVILDNIKEAVLFKKEHRLNVIVGVQFLMIPQNINELEKFVKLFKEIGVDNVQIKPYSHHPNSKNKINLDVCSHFEDKLKSLSSNNFKVFFRKETMERIQDKNNYSECFGLPFFALIDAKGNVIPCNLFYNSKRFVYGNIYKNSFRQIWKSKERQKVLKIMRRIGCKNCREGCRLDVINRYLNRLKNPEEHDNFI